jgi:hypothetical protein
MTAMVGIMPHPHEPHSASGSSSSHRIKKRAVCLQQQSRNSTMFAAMVYKQSMLQA